MRTKALVAMLLCCLTIKAANTTTTKSTQITSNVTVAANTDYVLTLTTNIFSSGKYINIPSSAMEHSVIIFKNVKPSVVISTWLSYVRINGATAVNGTNCQVRMYNKGAIIFPYGSSFQPLTCYTGTGYSGTSYSGYTTGSNGGYMKTLTSTELLNNFKSFKLKRGYMVTFATGTAGYGYSRCFVADTEDLEMDLPTVLSGKVSSYRLFQWYNFGKTGIANNTTLATCQALNVQGCYTYNVGDGSNMPDVEWLSHQIQPYWPGVAACGQNEYSCTMKTDNEPANASDDNPATVSQVLGYWEDAMRTGMRLCSPSTYDGSNNAAWFQEFFQAIDERGWRCDLYDIHCYWASFSNLYSYYTAYNRPLLISEWIWGASWNSNGAFGSGVTDSQIVSNTSSILTTLNNAAYVERYFYWNSESKAKIYDNGVTTLGQTYAATDGGLGYNKTYEYVPNVVLSNPYSLSGSIDGNSITLNWADKNGDMMDEIRVQYKTPNGSTWTTLSTVERKDKTGTGNQTYTFTGTLTNASNYYWRVVDVYESTLYESNTLAYISDYVNSATVMPLNIDDFFFQFYSKEASTDLVWAVYDSSSSENRVYYKAKGSDYSDLYQLWTLENNPNGGYSLKNLGESGYYINSANSWNFTTRSATSQAANTAFGLTYMSDGDYWIMTNMAHSMYVGLWDNDKTFTAGDVLAGNRTNPTGTSDAADKLGIRIIPKSDVTSGWDIADIEDGSYYLYNDEYKLYMSAGNKWDTQAIADESGIDFNLAFASTGYTLDSNISNGGNSHYLGSNIFCDSGAFEWSFKEAGTINGMQAYTISDGTSYLACPSTAKSPITTTTNVSAAAAKWILLTRDDLIEMMADASESNPMDVSFLIPGHGFGRNDARFSNWNGGPARNGYAGSDWGDFNGEKYNTTFDVYQLITDAPNGIYEVSMQGFYRDGGYDAAATLRTNGNEALNALLYANDQTLALPSIFSEAGNCGTQGVNQSTYGYIPNGQSDASYYIHDGLYATGPLRFTVVGESLRVGVKKTVSVGSDWTIFDNFKLVYLGPESVDPYWVALEACQQAAEDNESNISGAAQAALEQFEWTRAEYAGKSQSEILQAINVLNNATTISNASQVATDLIQNVDFTGGYSGNASGSRVQVPSEWTFDYTFSGWNDTYVDATNKYFNAWAGTITLANLSQTISNMPNGVYKLSADIMVDNAATNSKTALYGAGTITGRSEEAGSDISGSNDDYANYSTYFEVDNNSATIGIRSDYSYYKVKNITLEFVTNSILKTVQTDNSYLRNHYFWNGREEFEYDATGSDYSNAQTVKVYPQKPNQIIKVLNNSQFANTNNKVVNSTCANLVITDGSPLQITSATGAFTATNATYTRAMGTTAEWGTVILPYPLTTNSSVKFYEIYDVRTEDDVCTLMLEEVEDAVPANTPVVYRKLTSGATSITMAATSASVEFTNGSNEAEYPALTVTGLYFPETMDSGLDNIYYVAQNKFWKASGSLTIPAFRAYFTTSSNVKAINFIVLDDPTNIISIDKQTGEPINLPSNIYNLAGQLVKANATSLDALAPGIYVVGGKKYIKK